MLSSIKTNRVEKIILKYTFKVFFLSLDETFFSNKSLQNSNSWEFLNVATLKTLYSFQENILWKWQMA